MKAKLSLLAFNNYRLDWKKTQAISLSFPSAEAKREMQFTEDASLNWHLIKMNAE